MNDDFEMKDDLKERLEEGDLDGKRLTARWGNRLHAKGGYEPYTASIKLTANPSDIVTFIDDHNIAHFWITQPED